MMSIKEYRLLDETLREQLLAIDGVFLMIRKTKSLNVELYALYNFYVECFLDKQNGEPLYIRPFEEEHYLHVYLEGIIIDSVFSRTGGG